MSRLNDLGEILDSYDERFQHSWKSFLEGFEEEYCNVLNQFDDSTKRKLISCYDTVKKYADKLQKKDPINTYYDSIKGILNSEPTDETNNAIKIYQKIISSSVEGMEKFVGQFNDE